MSFQTITLTVNDGVATITLNRPEKRNALNHQLISDITEAATQVGQDSTVRAVILTANGTHFCAGADIEWMQQSANKTFDENIVDGQHLAKLYSTIHFLPKPTIARVTGDAFGGGVGLAFCTDITVSLTNVVFALPEVRLGIVPAIVSPYVVKAMGEHQARRFMLTGEVFSADVAERFGMLHASATSIDALDACIGRLIKSFKACGPNAIQETKRLIFTAAHSLIDQHLIDNTVVCTARVRSTIEGKEGLQSFLTKTKPNWF